MSKPKKKHHYLSQFYLAGFTDNCKKDGTLYCYDLRDKKIRTSIPSHEGLEKHFNTLELTKEDPNQLEDTLGQCEEIISRVFKFIIKNQSMPEGEQFRSLIYYIALLGVRNPAIRNSFNKFQNDLARKTMSFILQDDKNWEKFVEEKGYSNVSCEEMKEFINSERWKIVEPNDNRISREFNVINLVYDLLMKRNWSLFIINNSDHHFITSDIPVKLMGNIINNSPPGFGERDSELLFPINKNILIWGSFNKQSKIDRNICDERIALINTMQLAYFNRHIYSSTEKFILDRNNKIESSDILSK